MSELLRRVLGALTRRAKEGMGVLRPFDGEARARELVAGFGANVHGAVAMGSSSGAISYLCAALGMPHLPQTFLVRSGTHGRRQDVREAMEEARTFGAHLLSETPEAIVHHLHEPARHRTLLKRTKLGAAYEAWLGACVPPGGTIFVMESRRAVAGKRLGDRQVFQEVGPECADPDQITDAPDEDVELSAEAEFGFEPQLREDLEAFARGRGLRICRVLFDDPEELSPLVADLYAWWYRREGLQPRRLVVDASRHADAVRVVEAGAVPLWLRGTRDEDADALEEFLARTDCWDCIDLLLPEPPTQSAEHPSLSRWRELLAQYAREGGDVHRGGEGIIVREGGPLPAPMSLELLEQFLSDHGGASAVKWIEDSHTGELAVVAS